MASLTHDKHGYRLDFTVPGQPRKCVRLSLLGEDAAERARHHVEVALRSHRREQPIPVATIDWLYRSAPRQLLTALASVGIVDDRRLLGDAWRAYCSSKLAKVSGRRIESIERVGESLLGHFGDCELEAITPQALEAWVEASVGQLASNTLAGRSAIARQFFRWAVAERLLLVSPAAELSAGFHRSDRLVEVPGDVVHRLCDAALAEGDWELRLALLLARWGGLRAAEVLRVRISDVVTETRTLIVRDTKRAGHGYAERMLPIFPELQPVLEAVGRNVGRVSRPVPETTPHETPGRLGLLMPTLGGRTPGAADQRAKRLCERHGIVPWDRFWQNMRATRESELMDRFGLKDACKWIGNSPDVAMKHYAIVRRSEFERASMDRPPTENCQLKTEN